MTSPPAWRLILGEGEDTTPGAAAGARNMAVDHSLLDSVTSGGRPVLRLYRWAPACLSLGRNQHAAGLYDTDRVAAAGIDIVRRPTGGLAVLHDDELTYCVLAPVATLGGARAGYASINRALVAGLRRVGVPAELAAAAPARRPGSDAADPCFAQPAGGEVVAAGRKLVGSAQRCERGMLLQHGSILLGGDQSAVAGFVAHGRAGTVERPSGSISLRELLGTVPAATRLVDVLRSGFAEACGIRLAPDTITREERARADRLERHYRDAAWTWRR